MFYTEQFLDKNLKSTLGLNWADNRILNGRRHQIQGAQDLGISDPLISLLHINIEKTIKIPKTNPPASFIFSKLLWLFDYWMCDRVPPTKAQLSRTWRHYHVRLCQYIRIMVKGFCDFGEWEVSFFSRDPNKIKYWIIQYFAEVNL